MSKKIFITGLPGSGKSGLVREIIEELGIKAGGIITPEIREGGVRKGFKIIDLAGRKEGILSHTDLPGPRIGKYGVNLRDIEDMGVRAIENALEDPEIKLLVIDELGSMELCSQEFKNLVGRVIDSDKDFLIVLHRNFVKKYGRGQVFVLTRDNRRVVKERICELLR